MLSKDIVSLNCEMVHNTDSFYIYMYSIFIDMEDIFQPYVCTSRCCFYIILNSSFLIYNYKSLMLVV